MEINKFDRIIKDGFGILFVEFNGKNRVYEINCIDDNIEGLIKKRVLLSVNDQSIIRNHDDTTDTVAISDGLKFEVAISYSKRNELLPKLKLSSFDEKRQVRYRIGDPTVEYLIHILTYISSVENNPFFRSNFFDKPEYSSIFHYYNSFFERENCNLDLIELIQYLYDSPSVIEINIEFLNSQSFSQLIDSYIFEFAYRFDYVVEVVDEEVIRSPKNIIRDILPRVGMHQSILPMLVADKNVLIMYKRAVSTNNIEFQYLSFYHILEYYSDMLFIDRMTNPVINFFKKENIESGDPSDMKKLIKFISKENSKLNDENKLKLVIDKYIDQVEVDDLKEKSINLDFFKKESTIFSNLNKIDFQNNPIRDIVANLTKRIYKVRNNIVHRKSSVLEYVPTYDDRGLDFETDLIRVIAEIVILKAGSQLP